MDGATVRLAMKAGVGGKEEEKHDIHNAGMAGNRNNAGFGRWRIRGRTW